MKPFDLTKALAGDPVCTRDGRKVTDICLLKNAQFERNVIYLLKEEDSICYALQDGTLNGTCQRESEHDLFMAPKIKKYYAFVYRKKSDGHLWIGNVSEEIPATYEYKNDDLIKMVEFEIEE